MSENQESAEQRIAEIAARAEKATPGPMTVITKRDGLGTETEHFWCVKVGAWDSTFIERRADAEFYAEARSDIPWLLEQISALRAPATTKVIKQRPTIAELEAILDSGASTELLEDGNIQVIGVDRLSAMEAELSALRAANAKMIEEKDALSIAFDNACISLSGLSLKSWHEWRVKLLPVVSSEPSP